MPPDVPIKKTCDACRSQLLDIGNAIKEAKKHPDFKGEQSHLDQHSEMLANLTLAYRHIEDARMRLGKVLQAQDGGVSVYDKKGE